VKIFLSLQKIIKNEITENMVFKIISKNRNSNQLIINGKNDGEHAW